MPPVYYATEYGIEAGRHVRFLLRAEGHRHGDVISVSSGAGDKVQQVVDVNNPQGRPQHSSLWHSYCDVLWR